MNLSGTTVTPDKRKGLVMVEQVRTSSSLFGDWNSPPSCVNNKTVQRWNEPNLFLAASSLSFENRAQMSLLKKTIKFELI